MASTKKRKTSGESDTDETARQPKKPAKRMRSGPTSSKKIANRENLIMKLPGELRNEIYSLALGTNETYQIKPTKTKTHWRQSALLKVSKQIRAEASSVYYSSNRFIIHITADKDDIEEAHRWLKRISNAVPTGQNLPCELSVTSWWPKVLGHWYALSELSYDTGLRPSQVFTAPTKVCVMKTLKEAVKLGVTAKRQNLSRRELRGKFVSWMLTVYIGGVVRGGRQIPMEEFRSGMTVD